MKVARKNKKIVKKPKSLSSAKVKRGSKNAVITQFRLHRGALISSLTRLLRTPFSSAMAIAVMAIAITLAGSFYVLVNNGQQLVDSLQAGKQISLFLHEQVSDQQAEKFAQSLQANKQIAELVFISKQQALAEFQKYSGFGEALNALVANPLPAVIQVFPEESLTDAGQLTALLEQLQRAPQVDLAQMDMDWVMRLQSMMQIVNRVLLLLGGLLALAVAFVTGNTIRLELQARRDEVIVNRLVGATNGFICLPFLYSGFWFGFISGILAWLLMLLMVLMINTPVEQLSSLYQGHFELRFLSFSETLLLLSGASVLGILGALAVAYHQLKELKPE